MNAIKGKGRKEQRKSASGVRGSQRVSIDPLASCLLFYGEDNTGEQRQAGRERERLLPCRMCVCLRRNDTGGGWDAGECDAGPKSISVMAHQCPRTYKNNQAGSRMRATMAQKAIPIYFTAPN